MIYFDNAATSFPKPEAVIKAVETAMRTCGNPGRGSHRLAMRGSEILYECRREAADHFGAESAEKVVFTWNATSALNPAIKGLARPGDHILISDLEHNAVLRPVQKLADEGKITYDIFPSFATDPGRTAEKICRAVEEKITPRTRLLICTHASNICSAVMPIKELGALCKKHRIKLIVDGSQSAGHLPISMRDMKIDALCLPGHKGLLGPQGSGLLIWGKDIFADTLLEGGSGTRSLEPFMPTESPERYEAGTIATPAVAGLLAGIREVRRRGTSAIAREENRLSQLLQNALTEMPEVKLEVPHLRGPILLLNAKGIPSDVLAGKLDAQGVCTRAGYHCAGLAHKTLGTPDGGAVRVSFGADNTEEEVAAFVRTLSEILRKS